MTVTTIEHLQEMRKAIQDLKVESNNKRIFRLNDDIPNAVTCDELLKLYDDVERAIRDKLVLGQEPSELEKFAVRVVCQGIAIC